MHSKSGIPRCSQARLVIWSLQRVLGLTWGLLPVGWRKAPRRHPYHQTTSAGLSLLTALVTTARDLCKASWVFKLCSFHHPTIQVSSSPPRTHPEPNLASSSQVKQFGQTSLSPTESPSICPPHTDFWVTTIEDAALLSSQYQSAASGDPWANQASYFSLTTPFTACIQQQVLRLLPRWSSDHSSYQPPWRWKLPQEILPEVCIEDLTDRGLWRSQYTLTCLGLGQVCPAFSPATWSNSQPGGD